MKKIFKILIGVLLIFLVYKAAYIHALLKFADHMRECLPQSQVCELAKQDAPTLKVEAAITQTLACVKQKQGVIESVVFKVPLEEDSKDEGSGRSSSVDYKNLLEMCADWTAPKQR